MPERCGSPVPRFVARLGRKPPAIRSSRSNAMTTISFGICRCGVTLDIGRLLEIMGPTPKSCDWATPAPAERCPRMNSLSASFTSVFEKSPDGSSHSFSKRLPRGWRIVEALPITPGDGLPPSIFRACIYRAGHRNNPFARSMNLRVCSHKRGDM